MDDSNNKSELRVSDRKWTIVATLLVVMSLLIINSYWNPNLEAEYEVEMVEYEQKQIEMEIEYANITDAYGEYSFEAVTYKEIMDDELNVKSLRLFMQLFVWIFIGIFLIMIAYKQDMYLIDDCDDEFGFEDDDDRLVGP